MPKTVGPVPPAARRHSGRRRRRRMPRRRRRGRRRAGWGSPRLPRRRSRQVRTYSEGERRCCHGSGAATAAPRIRRRRVAPGRAQGRRRAGPTRAGRPRSRRAGGGAGRAWPAWAAHGRRCRGRAGRRRAGGAATGRRGGAGGPGRGHALVTAPRRDRRAGRSRPARRGRRRLVPGRAAGARRRARPGHHRSRPRTMPVAARPPSPRWAPSAMSPACRPCSARWTTSPTVRRRATVALAGFDDPRVTPALRAATEDRGLAGAPGGRRIARRALVRRAVPSRRSVKSRFRRSKDSRQTPAPCTTHSSGVSTRCTGTAVASARRWVMPRSSAPPPVRWTPWNMMSCASSGGASPRHSAAAATMDATLSSSAPRTSSGESTTVLGRPVATSRPRISACCSLPYGKAEPMASFTASAVRSPTATPYWWRT